MEGPKHERHSSVKAARPRKATIGPLGMPNVETGPSPEAHTKDVTPSTMPEQAPKARFLPKRPTLPEMPKKRLGYLLRPEIYHPLSALNVPPAMRSEFFAVSARDTFETLSATLDEYLSTGQFLHAAQLAAGMLTSPTVDPTDSTTIFALLYVRLACLELTGNITVAAQESKALEDLASDFYYFEIELPSSEAEENIPDEERQSTYLEHIVPWELRVLTTRLQGIAFGDPRRGINGLYDLGMDARGHLSQQGLAKDERELWKARLADLGMRVVNALVEMDDLETARRTLASLKPSNQSNSFARMALLYLQLGDVDSARALCEQVQGGAGAILECLLIMAEGHYTEAVGAWKALLQARSGKDDEALITQNLAVCLLYCGMLNESRELLESLVDRGHSFQSLIYNLATIYELCSERSQFAMKTALTERVAQQTSSHETNWERPNIEFKI